MKKLLFLLALTIAIPVFGEGYKPGDTVKDFRLKNIDGEYVSMSDYDDASGFIVVFTCNGCPYAQAYEDRIKELDREFKAKGYPVIAINPNSPVAKPADSFEKMQERAAQKEFTFPYLVDETQEVYKTWGATVTPHVFVVEKVKDKMKVAYIGAVDNNYKDAASADQHYVKDAVNALLASSKPATSSTKAIGCGIK